MNSLHRIAFLIIVTVGGATPGEDYKIRAFANDKEVAVVDLSIDAEEATVKVDGFSEKFDLKQQRWQHDKRCDRTK